MVQVKGQQKEQEDDIETIAIGLHRLEEKVDNGFSRMDRRFEKMEALLHRIADAIAL